MWSSPVALAKIVVLFLGFAVQSSVEEILFRGWLMSAIARKLNVAWAVVLVSLVFMLCTTALREHWSLMLGTFLALRLRLGLAGRQRLGSHGLGSALELAARRRLLGADHRPRRPGARAPGEELSPVGSDALTGGAEGPEGGFPLQSVLAAASAWLFWRYLRNHAPRREET